MAEKKVKKRHWAFVAYPESLPDDWFNLLKQTGLKIAISPLHDRDVNADGTPKKPHYHIMLSYEGPTTYGNVEHFTRGTMNGTIPQPLESPAGMYRYLTHEDNPEKVQYDKADIRTLNGFNIRDFVEMSKTEAIKTKREITQYILDNGVKEYADLMLMTMCDDAPSDWYDVASSNTLYFTALIRSERYKATGRE